RSAAISRGKSSLAIVRKATSVASEVVKSRSDQQRVALGDAERPVLQLVAVEVDLDAIGLAELALDEGLRQRVLDVALERASEGPRAVGAIRARLVDDPPLRVLGELDADLAALDRLVDLLDEQADDREQVVFRERLEDDDLVEPVDELRVEGLLDGGH